MKTTGYTNAVLTVIAACLLWLCGENLRKPVPVQAQGPVGPELLNNFGVDKTS